MGAYEQETQVVIARKASSKTITLGQMKALSSNQMRILRNTGWVGKNFLNHLQIISFEFTTRTSYSQVIGCEILYSKVINQFMAYIIGRESTINLKSLVLLNSNKMFTHRNGHPY